MCHEIFVILLQFKVQICSIIISTTTLPLYKNCKLYVNFFFNVIKELLVSVNVIKRF